MNTNIYNPYVRKELELYHHGIQGQKWGKRNGPPYPLNSSTMSSREKKAKYEKKRLKAELKENRKKVNIKSLSDEELNRRINRLKKENEYARLLGLSDINGANRGKQIAKNAFNSVGSMLVVPMAVGAATYGLKWGFGKLGPNIVSNHMDAWTGLGREMFKNVNRMKK